MVSESEVLEDRWSPNPKEHRHQVRAVTVVDLFVKVFVPHVVDDTAGTTHEEGSCSEQSQHPRVRQMTGASC